MVAAKTTLPVIGVLRPSRALAVCFIPSFRWYRLRRSSESRCAALFALSILSVREDEGYLLRQRWQGSAEEQGKIAERSTNELN